MKNEEKAILSSARMNNEGIKTQITQNDVVEIIAEEKFRKLSVLAEKLLAFPKNLKAEFQKIDEKTKNSLISAFRKKFHLKKTDQVTFRYDQPVPKTPAQKMEIKILRITEKGKVTQDYTRLSVEADEVLWQMEHASSTKEKNGSSSIRLFQSIKVPNPLPWKQEVEMIKEHNAQVDAFVEMFSGTLFTEAAIAAKSRREVNRHIIRSQAPEVKAAIDKIFNIDL